MPRASLLPLPVREAVTRVAQEYLDDAAAAVRRLRDPRDAEALHDFRVAVRRLRSLLRGYRRWVSRPAAKKVRRRLRELGRATNAGRDAEVQLAWLQETRPELARRERAGCAWLARRLRARRRDGYRAARRHVRADFHKNADLVRRRLETAGPAEPTFRTAFVTLLREHADDLAACLAAVGSPEDEDEAHEARIRAKRLRYLLEPVRSEAPAVRRAVARLRGLQDVLGELHDAHALGGTLAEALDAAATEKAHLLRDLALAGDDAALSRERRRDERLGLVALAARARARRDARFATLARNWLGAAGGPFFQELEALAATLSGAPVTATPPVERERKYLLSALPDPAANLLPLEIEQGWLPGDRLRERLRRVRENGMDRFYRTVKLGSGVERVELDEETTPELFAALWPHTEGCRVVKRRHRVPDGAFTWEIDAFADRDLVLAEVELPARGTEVTIPDWLAPHVVREVTDDPDYVNLNLAR